MGFVHLHVHTEYSLLDGACRIRDLPKLVKELGQTACAITDHGGENTTISEFKKELRMNEVYYMLNKALC